MSRSSWTAAGLLVVAATAPLLANGGTVRVSREAIGRYVVSVMTSPTPLRTGEIDISVLVQDSTHEVVPGVPVEVEAVPVDSPAAAVRHPATRQQATNKFFVAAKFDVDRPGDWEFRVQVGQAEGGTVAFRTMVSRTTILDRPYVLAGLILLPLLLIGWVLGRREGGENAARSGASGAGMGNPSRGSPR